MFRQYAGGFLCLTTGEWLSVEQWLERVFIPFRTVILGGMPNERGSGENGMRRLRLYGDSERSGVPEN